MKKWVDDYTYAPSNYSFETMKYILPAAIIFLALPAAAVDYVKCEAMQNANNRLLNSADQAKKDVWQEVLAKYELKSCGERPDQLKPGNNNMYLAYSDCTTSAYIKNYDSMVQDTNSDPRVAAPLARAAKVQADYKKAGCF
jgi:hypothetical protein